MSKTVVYDSVGSMPRAEKPRAHNFNDLEGQVFGRLTASHYAGNCGGKTSGWACQCSCGTLTVVSGAKLRRGETRSCGCLVREGIGERSRTHGLATRGVADNYLLRTYEAIKRRCTNPNEAAYRNYGARGIRCDFRSFEEFYAYIKSTLGPRPDNWTLDRIDNDGSYCEGNLKWSDRTAQARNRRSNRLIEVGGRTVSMAEAAELSGVPYFTLSTRLNAGWTEYEALHTPRYSRVRAQPPTEQPAGANP